MSMRVPAIFLVVAFGWGITLFAQAPATIDDGPYLFHRPDGSVEARWIEASQPRRKVFAAKTQVVLPRFATFFGPGFVPAPHAPAPAIHAMPERLLAISDVEGEYERMRRFLEKHGVIDARGAWTYGKNHLVCVGDFVDRGEQVTEVLWHLHRLDREARAAGGALHFLIGNHEAMVMAGDVRYTAPKYPAAARLLGQRGPKLYGADTELGRWLRTRNTVVRIGEVLFVHAGISPEVVAADLSLDDINRKIRDALGRTRPEIEDAGARWLATDRRGPLWYRGYFPRFADSFGPRPHDLVLDGTLRRMGARSIVIGHTKVREVAEIYSRQRVVDIDTTWTSDEKVRGLLWEKGRTEILKIDGSRQPFGTRAPSLAPK